MAGWYSLKAYIAGPMTGIQDLNRSAFEAAERYLLARGIDCHTPFAVARVANVPNCEENVPELLGLDFAAIRESDAVVLIPGWRSSRGALAEVCFALREEKTLMELSYHGALTILSGVSIAVNVDRSTYTSIFDDPVTIK